MYSYLSSSPGYTNMYSSPLGISCGMDAPRGALQQQYTAFGSSSSIPLTPRDSTLPVFPWCFGDLASEQDSGYETFQDPSDSPQMWSQHNQFMADVQAFTMPMLPSQWGTQL